MSREQLRALALSTLVAVQLLWPAVSYAGVAWEKVDLAFWPEYDKPAVLVIYRAQIAAEVTLPTAVELPIPAAAGEPHAVAIRGNDGQLWNAEHQFVPGDPWGKLTIQATAATLQAEFYLPLPIEGAKRSFSFQWPGGFTGKSFTYEIFQPAGATSMEVKPPPAGAQRAEDGAVFLKGLMPPIALSSGTTIEIRYDKQDAILAQQPPSAPPPPPTAAANPLPVDPAAAAQGQQATAQATPAQEGEDRTWLWGVGLAVLALLAALAARMSKSQSR